MIRHHLRGIAAALLVSSVTLNIVACGGSDPSPTQTAQKPTADAGAATRDGKVGQAVTLDGSASKGANAADKLAYSWAIVSAPGGSKAAISGAENVQASFTPDAAGAYVIELLVTDAGTHSDPAKITINAAATDTGKPVAAATATPSTPEVGDTITLDGSTSSDSDGDKLTYKWTLSGPTGSAATLSSTTAIGPTFTADVAGDYDATLIVNDGNSDSAAFALKISVAAVPQASAVASKTSAAPGDSIDLDGSASKSVKASDTLTYQWSIKSEPKASKLAISATDAAKEKLSVTLDVAGDYDFELVVTEGTERSEPADVKVSAEVAVAPTPTASATASKTSAAPGDSIDLDGSASKPGTAGDTLTYSWSIKSEPMGSKLALTATEAAASKLTVALDVAGDYDFELIVKEGTVSSAPVDVKVTAAAVAAKPTASIAAVAAGKVSVAMTLDGSGSKPATASDALKYAWTITSGQASSTLTNADQAKPTFEATKAGTYQVQLIVTEGTTASDPQVVSITVN